MTPIRIWHIFNRMNRGGAELRTLEVVRAADPERFAFTFCVLGGEGDLDPELRALGAEIIHCRRSLGFGRRFAALLRSHPVDVLHSHAHYFSAYLLRIAAKCGIRGRVAHFRTTVDPRDRTLRGKLRRLVARRWLDRYATHILGVSEAALTAAWGAKWPTDARCRLAYNGIDLSAFEGVSDGPGVRVEHGLPEDCRLVVHIGRFNVQKNHVRLVAIFDEIRRCEPNARFLMVGRGGNEPERATRAALASRGLEPYVRIVGERSDVPRVLMASDLMVFPSIREGLPGVLLEATAAGTPVLASDLPETREIARYLPSVRLEPLTSPDPLWAEQAARILRAGPDDRAAVRATMSRSPFLLESAVARLATVWTEAGGVSP